MKKKISIEGKISVNNEDLKVVGIDVANSTLKVWTDDNQVMYRNTIKQVDDAGLVYSFETKYKMYVYENEIYEVGDLSATGSGGRGIARYGSKQFKIEAIIGIASALKTGDSYRLRIVTGVPSFLAKNQEVINDIKKVLIGNHKVQIATYETKEEVEFEIVEVIVVPQPLGTMYTYVYDEKTKKINKKFVEQRALIVDIGWGTTDIAILESGRVRSTFGFDIGTSDYISEIQAEVNNDIPKSNIRTVNSHELDMRLLEDTTVETPFGTFDLSPYTEKNKKKQAERLYSEIMALGLEFNKFYRIILTGGGTILYEKYLREIFNDPRLIIQEDAIRANANGFYLLGQY